jgi:anthranilate synthase component 1
LASAGACSEQESPIGSCRPAALTPSPRARCVAEFAEFKAASSHATLVPLFRRILSDHLTPVLAYRCLVKQDDREAPSFLLESVVNGNTSVRDQRSPSV